MLRMNYPSPSASLPPLFLPSSCSSFQGVVETENSLLTMDRVLNMSPRPSYNFISTVNYEKTSEDKSVSWESKKTLSLGPVNSIASDGTSALKSSAELIKEIGTLELEITHLERYLLSLYRTAFVQQLPKVLENPDTDSKHKLRSPLQATVDQFRLEDKPGKKKGGTKCYERTFPMHLGGKDDQSAATTPKSSGRVRKNADTGHRSLADHLGATLLDNAPRGPDRLSEDIVRCISSIYCKLASPTPVHTAFSFSSSSSLSSSTTLSPRNLSDNWSPHFNEESIGHCRSQGLKEECGPHAALVEVLKIHLDDDSFNYAAQMLQNFRSLVKSLEKVDPRKMKREEKLTFWINIHNALVMHAHLAYGTHNYVRSSSVLKAAYNVGGLCINACIIQSSILGIRSHYSAPWLHSLLSSGKKFKTGISKHAYAIEYPEPLVHFALCSGAYSDPVVRVYTAKTVFQDLRRARDEFINTNVYIQKETKVYLPKILGYFAKDTSLSMSDLLEMVNDCLIETQQGVIRRCVKGRPEKNLYWLPQASTFRYLIHREVNEGRLSV